MIAPFVMHCCSRCEIKDFNARREDKDHMTRSSLALAFCPLQTEMRKGRESERERERERKRERERQRERTRERERERARER